MNEQNRFGTVTQMPASVNRIPTLHGTLVWVGPQNLEICSETFSFCVSRFPQIAVRHDLKHSLEFPAQGVTDVIVVRQDRSLPACLKAFQSQYPSARLWAMSASECEGERRTGALWPGFEHFYWHQWNQVLPAWFAADTKPSAPTRSIRLISADFSNADALAECLAAKGHTVAIQVPHEPENFSGAGQFNFDTVIWDDTAAPPTDVGCWTARIRSLMNASPKMKSNTAVRATGTKHVWCCSFPRIDQWRAAKAAGIHALLSKPCSPLAWDAIHA